MRAKVAAATAALLMFAAGCAAEAADNLVGTAESPAEVERRALELWRGNSEQAAAAAKLFEIGVAQGRAVSQWALASQYREGHGVRRDMAKSFALMRSAGAQGFADAQTVLGWMLLTGTGTARDAPAAAQWLGSAARQGSPRAFSMLGDMYLRGEGVAQDFKIGHGLLRRAAELGDDVGALRFGSMSLFGPDEYRSVALGVFFLERAADLKNPEAPFVLGQALLFGKAVPRDFVRAAHWMQRAADVKHHYAMLWLSELYAKGLGVSKDSQRASQLLEAGLAMATPRMKNDFAWQLSVASDAVLRDGARALQIMQTMLQEPSAKRPDYIDTLAAAYAEVGDFESAVAAQQQALTAQAKLPPNAEQQAGMQRRLENYRSRKPFREELP